MAVNVNFMTDKLPNELILFGESYPIHTDFRRWILVVELLGDSGAEPYVKLEYTARMILERGVGLREISRERKRTLSDTFAELARAAGEFALCGRTLTHGDLSGGICPQAYDFTYDSDLLYASFLQAYGIDLTDRSVRMHFWKFMSLLRCLPRDTVFMRAAEIRTADMESAVDDEARRRLRRAKAAVRIRKPLI